VHDEETEPDPRFTLANERTFLAWLRTALALTAAGVAVVQIVPDFAFPRARQVVGAALTALGGALALLAVRRWQRVQAALRRNEALPPTRVPLGLALCLAATSLGVLVLLLATPAG
jgi:putative membrane protein